MLGRRRHRVVDRHQRRIRRIVVKRLEHRIVERCEGRWQRVVRRGRHHDGVIDLAGPSRYGKPGGGIDEERRAARVVRVFWVCARGLVRDVREEEAVDRVLEVFGRRAVGAAGDDRIESVRSADVDDGRRVPAPPSAARPRHGQNLGRRKVTGHALDVQSRRGGEGGGEVAEVAPVHDRGRRILERLVRNLGHGDSEDDKENRYHVHGHDAEPVPSRVDSPLPKHRVELPAVQCPAVNPRIRG